MCGVGAGWMQEFVAVGQDFLPREKRLDEMLEVLGVDGVVIPARTLATTSDTDDVIAGIERYSARR